MMDAGKLMPLGAFFFHDLTNLDRSEHWKYIH